MRAILLGPLLYCVHVVACGGSGDTPSSPGDAGVADAPAPITPPAPADAGPTDAAVDPCGSALLCETFEGYAGVTALADKQKIGPWQASLSEPGATMALDGTHRVSGGNALHVHIDDGTPQEGKTGGGRLVLSGNQPVLAGAPTHLYGRLMMYIDPNGYSVNWAYFSASGDNGETGTKRTATYNLTSLENNNANGYAFVYGLSELKNDAGATVDHFHDCYFHSKTPMPTTGWSCLAFELDSTNRKLRLSKDGTEIASVDETGQGCVAPTPGASPWYGPAISQLYTGALSFHQMHGALDVWIDDLVVDTKPVSCPAQ